MVEISEMYNTRIVGQFDLHKLLLAPILALIQLRGKIERVYCLKIKKYIEENVVEVRQSTKLMA